jgi:Xaa-Pro aminopeptidase
MKISLGLWLVLSCLSSAAQAQAQFANVNDTFSPSTFEARRQKLSQAIPNSLVILFGAKSLIDTWDEQRYYPHFRVEAFRQDETLFYLTGFGAPNAVAVYDTDSKILQFYAAAATPQIEMELRRLSLPALKSLDEFDADVDRLMVGRPIYLLTRDSAGGAASGGFLTAGTAVNAYSKYLPGGTPGTYREDVIKETFLKRFPKAEIRSIIPVTLEMRKTLDAEEIAAIRKAVEIDVQALSSGLRVVRPGVDDIQVGAVMECTMRLNGSQIRAYAPDVQSGSTNNMQWYTELLDQYDSENRTLKAGDLDLVDQGAEFSYYQSDLARLVPVDGKFTPEQRVLYDAMLKVYEAGMAAIGPGVSFNHAAEVASAEMVSLIPSLPEWARPSALKFSQNMKLGPPGHFLSTTLDLHRDSHLPLKPGQVMAYELHWWVPERNWRFTIEDDILVTPEGHDVLSNGLPRTADGLMKLLASHTKIGCSAPDKPIASSH